MKSYTFRGRETSICFVFLFNWRKLLTERICSLRSRLLPLREDPIFEELGLPGKYHISLAIGQVVFSFQNNPNYLDLSYKTDLDFLDCFEWETPIL